MYIPSKTIKEIRSLIKSNYSEITRIEVALRSTGHYNLLFDEEDTDLADLVDFTEDFRTVEHEGVGGELHLDLYCHTPHALSGNIFVSISQEGRILQCAYGNKDGVSLGYEDRIPKQHPKHSNPLHKEGVQDLGHVLFRYNDAGREAAGFKGYTGDCVTRAITIATGLPYKDVYNTVNELSKPVNAKRVKAGRKHRVSRARTGVAKKAYHPWLLANGFTWHPTMQIGKGCQVHLHKDELPGTGVLIIQVSKHVVAYAHGVLLDTYDCSRDGKRCVYGYYTKNG